MMKAAELEEEYLDIQPERNMIAAIIWRALSDLDSAKITEKWEREDAREWLLEDSSKDEPFSLAWCCEQLFEGESEFWVRLIRKGAKEVLCDSEARTPEEKARKFNADFRSFRISQPSGSQTLPFDWQVIEGGKR